MNKIIFAVSLCILTISCRRHTFYDKPFIMTNKIDKITDSLVAKYGTNAELRIEKGVKQAAQFWTQKDGNEADFENFCINNFIGNTEALDTSFMHLSNYLETIFGNYNRLLIDLRRQIDLDIGPILPIDQMFASYDISSHFSDDLFENKIAFLIVLNFPHYTLKEKNDLGKNWTRKEWAYARIGDLVTSRVPAKYQQDISNALVNSEIYINEYNIYVGQLTDNEGKTYFNKNMKLLSHWNLRDEIKANYGKENGLAKQKLIYEAMKHIILQDIPKDVINSEKYLWNPYTNKIVDNGKETTASPEPDTRYKKLIDNFHALRAIDNYYPDLNTYIKRKFEGEMEVSQEDVEKLFIEFISSPQVKRVAELIKKRLGHELQPFDIWYDGFKERSNMNNEGLDAITKSKYPNNKAFNDDLVNILQKLSFSKDRAEFIASKIQVDPARGSGHAWGAQMYTEKSHLRTRIGSQGMDYKGFNVAMHEFGHNVEQIISLNDVDFYALSGVPNTAFTEALAFIFQSRDLEILGKKDNNPVKQELFVLDNFWTLYEIMGVSLVDMNVWKWLYANPEASASDLKKAVLEISKNIWNKYYADVFGQKDQYILAIYSHMISSPLYLSAYPLGFLIEFQLEQYLTGKNFGNEIERMYTTGKLTPKEWMLKAVDKDISINPMLNSVNEALNKLN